MEEQAFKAEERIDLGSAASKRLRRDGFMPVNLYGHKEANRHVAVDYRSFARFVSDGHRMLTLDIGGKKEHGVIKEIQYDGMGTRMIHADVSRVDLSEKISLLVKIETFGVSKGQGAGGTLDIALNEVHVRGSANKIPEKIEVRVAELDLNDTVRIKDLEIPEGCEFEHDDEDVVLAVHAKREAVEEEAPAESGETAEPEVISKKKDDEESVD